MKRAVHRNSLEVYPIVMEITLDQERQILLWLKNHPGYKTCRAIAKGTKIELSSVRRACHNLEYPKKGISLVDVANLKNDKNRTVKHFKIKIQISIF